MTDLKDVVLAELATGTHTEAFADGARWAVQEAAKLAPRPVIDREAVRRLMADALNAYVQLSTPGYYNYVDSFVALARPMPTEVEIAERVRQIFIDGGAHRTHAQEAASEIADAVLALFNGSES